ncbi:MAG: SH3 domain-containing protein [Alphaproteobacteria bacterium]|nr:SH3 domain-containing protein [Alphaproteobacteria bacterium]
MTQTGIAIGVSTGRGIRGFLLFSAAFFVACLIAVGAAPAASPEKSLKFLGVNLEPYSGTYVVLKDVTIRAAPKTKSKRLGSYKAGRRIQVVGFAGGAWVAVREKGRDVGFVYAKVLLPLIDGTLARDLTGKATAKGKAKGEPDTECRYIISFEGKSAVEGQVFEIADYDVVWDCVRGKRKVKFRTPMFITEAPYQLSEKRIFQITVDVVDLDRGYDEILSTFILFNMEKGEVLYDGVSLEAYGRTPAIKKAPAKTVEDALKETAGIALQVWNNAAWKDLIKKMPDYTDSAPENKKPEKPPGKPQN